LAALLKLAGIPRSTFYSILSRLDRPDRHASLREAIREICAEHQGRYGYRRVTLDLRERGLIANHKLVMKLMKEEQLTCQVRMKKYRSYRGEIGKVAPDLIQRDFSATAPNQKWTTDITEFSLFGSTLYLSPILDMFNSEIVDYTISDRPVFKQVTDMVKAAFSKIPDRTNLIFHSDQGWQYQHRDYQKMLQDKGVRQSMSRKGNCLDNSIIENFFGLLKSELLYLQDFESLEHFKRELVEYIDYYNNRRIKLKLKGMSPVKFRTHSQLVA
jgi:putative transposase